MQFSANAKINLGLFIKQKRPDGYHELESLFIPIDWCDEVSFKEAEETTFTSTGIPIPSDPNGNLILQAYHLLQKKFDLPPLNIHLEKNIPIGAGLGGGSSDASQMLLNLNEHYSLGLSKKELLEYALELGSDCPFFIENKVAIAKGRGEILDYDVIFNLRAKVLIVVPPIHISTAKAYSLVKPKEGRKSIKELVKKDVSFWQDYLTNDFEAVLCDEYGQLAKLRKTLLDSGADFVSMSGSGSAFYAIYTEEMKAVDLPSDYHQKLVQIS